MAKDKKSFILYADLITVVTKLVLKDRENKTNYAGELFLTILEFVNDKEPIPLDFIVEMAFEPIKLSLKRDLKKYETYIEKQVSNGKKGGRPKKSEITQPLISEPKKADSVNVSDTVSVNEIINNNTINVDDVFISEYLPKYKTYCNQILKDSLTLENLNRMHKISMNNDVLKNTIKKYLRLFLSQISISQEKHENLGKFNGHFSNYLRKQPKIELVSPKQKEERYV